MDKPPYCVPSMAEIKAVPWNGLNVVSTFSGCGGSCLGYRMAGFRVLWANEFVPNAQENYRLNHPGSILDTRDVRTVEAQEILKATGMEVGELDLFDGSPPCQAFSTAGKRDKGWGHEKKYDHGAKQCNERLFDEYIRLLRGLKPKIFIAENVSGLIKGKAKGFFLNILRDMKASGYVVQAKLLDAQWLGVPQMRQRIIFVGVREDLGLKPAFPKPFKHRYSVREALPWIVSCESGPTGFGVGSLTPTRPAPAVSASMQAPYSAHKVVSTTGRNVTVVSPGEPSPSIQAGGIGGGNTSQYYVEEESSMDGYAVGREWDTLARGQKSNKYINLIRAHPDKPSNTVTMSGGNASTASVTHPTEKRKFSIAELKRICAFPDDFQLTGSYAKQWARLGNSVPPLMMYSIAKPVLEILQTHRMNPTRP